jgi:predicted glutamine amidotransferase
MCRWITLLSSSEPVNLSDLVLKAENSLVKMSFNAGYHPGFGPTNNSLFNGDGFGVGWYHDKIMAQNMMDLTRRERYERSVDMKPALFRDVLPAWSDSNLQEVCLACRSHCIVAHVRA